MTDQTRKAGSSTATTAPKEKDAATGGEKRSETPKEHQDHALDEGIEESFPASDPVAVKITK